MLCGGGCTNYTTASVKRGPDPPRPPSVDSVDLVLTNGKRMVKALPMALPGGPQGCMTIGYYRGGDKAPQKRPDG